MHSTPLTLLIDTNVWLDALLPNRPGAEAARTLLEEAEKRGIAESGFRCIMNTGADGGQTVMHLHMHVLGGAPLGDGLIAK